MSLLRVFRHEILARTAKIQINQLLIFRIPIHRYLEAASAMQLVSSQNSLNFSRTDSGKSWLDCQSSSGYVSKFVESPACSTLGTIGG